MDTILIVDDEEDIRQLLRDYFELHGWRVLAAGDGEQAIKKASAQPDIILLDVNMPEMDGLSVCRRIRQFVPCPILFLTARVEDADKLEGFAAGGDDYIVKPFSMAELGARVDAHLRRERRRSSGAQVRFDDALTVDYAGRCAYLDGRPLGLAKKEFDILELLTQNAGQVFDRERIYERVWGYDSDGDSSVVAEHIRRLRVHLGRAGGRIKTVWGVGYKWD